MTRAQPFHVCIVGGGVAGLACALAAARAGARVELHEAQGQRGSWPAHVNVPPNLMRDLVALGVAERVAVEGFPYRRMVVRDVVGRVSFEMPWESLAGPRHPAAVGIAYDTLVRVLEEAALAAGASLHRSSKVDDVELDGGRAVIRRNAFQPLRPDLAVLATGADCALRDSLFPDAKTSTVWPQRWLHTLLPRHRGLNEMSLTMAPGGGPKLMLAPVDGCLAGMTISHHGVGSEAVRIGAMPDEILSWLQRASDWTRSIATSLTGRFSVVERPVRSGLIAGGWHRGNVVLAGDCAHVLAPQFGQSVAQGVEDAVVIGHLVHAARQRDGAALGELYTARRCPRAARVHGLVDLAARWDVAPNPSTDLTVLARDLLDAVALPP